MAEPETGAHMTDTPVDFFTHPILNSPYEYPGSHWELDEEGQPTNRIEAYRRRAKFITPVPMPKKRRSADQQRMVFGDQKGLSTAEQQYEEPRPSSTSCDGASTGGERSPNRAIGE